MFLSLSKKQNQLLNSQRDIVCSSDISAGMSSIAFILEIKTVH